MAWSSTFSQIRSVQFKVSRMELGLDDEIQFLLKSDGDSLQKRKVPWRGAVTILQGWAASVPQENDGVLEIVVAAYEMPVVATRSKHIECYVRREAAEPFLEEIMNGESYV